MTDFKILASLSVVMIVIAAGLCLFTMGAITWPYIIGAWALYLGKTVAIAWWQGGLIGLVPVIGPMGIPVSVMTWIVMSILL